MYGSCRASDSPRTAGASLSRKRPVDLTVDGLRRSHWLKRAPNSSRCLGWDRLECAESIRGRGLIFAQDSPTQPLDQHTPSLALLALSPTTPTTSSSWVGLSLPPANASGSSKKIGTQASHAAHGGSIDLRRDSRSTPSGSWWLRCPRAGHAPSLPLGPSLSCPLAQPGPNAGAAGCPMVDPFSSMRGPSRCKSGTLLASPS